jgi:poly-gamma-glutamate synthesis protein (capsule biosynthesis protein)
MVRILLSAVILLGVVSACQPAPSGSSGANTPAQGAVTPTVKQPGVTFVAPTATAIPPTPTTIPSPTPSPVKSVWVDPVLPTILHDAVVAEVKELAGQEPNIALSDDPASDIIIDAKTPGKDEQSSVLISRTYAIAAPFPTVADSITQQSLLAFWQGQGDALDTLTNDGSQPTLFLDPETRAALTQILGEPSADTPIQLVEKRDLVATTWAARPGSFAILPFDELETRWKLIWLDGMNLFEKSMDSAQYPLTLYVRARTKDSSNLALVAQLPTATNRDVSKLAVVAMTGVTALVRGTAVMMERKGITYPAELIHDWLATADVTHISNEVSFWDICPFPTFNDGTSMCSNPKYIELLKYVGTDIIDLSGNHLWDKGADHLQTTLQMYDELGWKYFAGGANYTDSLKPVTMTVDGNKLAFVGCNWFGSDWATPNNDLAGSALCGSDNPHDLDLITPTIQSLTQEGYLVIATIQYAEFYTYEPTAQQEADFKALRDAGAVVVNGSQGHHVQGFDVSAAGFIHYGTGNLFFGDQEGVGTHQTFVDRHAFYDGHYLGSDLRSAFIENYSQPRPMKPDERASLLKTLFAATGY